MKTLQRISVLVIFATVAFASCKKCLNCTSEASTNYLWDEGTQLEVSSGIVNYKGLEYLVGDTFTIERDTLSFGNGLQFEGEGKVRISSEFCEKGRIYDNMQFEYERNGWVCSEVKKKDVAKENR